MLSIFSTQENTGLGKNLAFATVSQGVSLLSSIIMSLIVPKALGVEDYAYWQLFLLYSSYTGLALLGLNDGIYLRLGGRRYTELDQGRLKAQISTVCGFQVAVGLACLAALFASGGDASRRLVFVLVVAYGLVANLTSCLRYVFQSTNLTQISSIADMLSKASFLVCVLAVLLSGGATAWPFITLYTVCQALSLAYILVCARKTLIARPRWAKVLSDCRNDIVAGIKITISYYADSLIVGITRMMVDWRLGLATFGKISFAFSLTNFVLGFIGQVSMVLFPVLKRLDGAEQRHKYLQIRSALHVLLPLAYLLYVPVRVILGWWLPQYEESLLYLALTLPLCIYSCKANFLFDTYLKMGRHEGVLGAVNVFTMSLNAALSAIAVFGFASVEWAAIGIVASVVVRDFFFERYEASEQGVEYLGSCLSELALSAGFMAASWVLGLWSWVVVAIMLAAYLAFNRGEIAMVVSAMKSRLRR
jgi:O-antigen/teichoic acid export membrane protein